MSPVRTATIATIAVVACALGACTSTDAPKDAASSTDTSTRTTAAVGAPSAPAAAGQGFDKRHVTVHLRRLADGPETISFGLPVAAGRITEPSAVKVSVGGKAVDAHVRAILHTHDASAATGIRAVEIQFPASLLTSDEANVDIRFSGGSSDSEDVASFADTSVEATETAHVADYTVVKAADGGKIKTSNERDVELFTGREPAVAAEFPPGYLAATGILGPQALPTDPAAAKLGGLTFIDDAITPFGLSAIWQQDYPVNAESLIVPDKTENYEAWLYDRCATYLLFYAHTNDPRFLREAYRACSYYAAGITLDGDDRGIWSGKDERDTKYSHLRGLYAYYALTGDETALAAGTAIADLWSSDPDFVTPYAAGRIRNVDALWTERLLGVSLEGLVFGYQLTGQTKYLDVAEKLFDTAYRHLTGDADDLAAINPDSTAFPPQNCFIHNAAQAAEGNEDEPWCSPWMIELLLPGVLEYQAITDDDRVDEMLVRLTRFLRDTGTAYEHGDIINESSFLKPPVPYDPHEELDSARILVPVYGAGVNADGKLVHNGEYDDFLHCLDASAMVAAGIRALKHQGRFDDNAVGPFKSEGESFLALENELLFCAQYTFADQTRLNRDPRKWTADDLADGISDPAKFVTDNKIGYVSYNNEPERRISWWFNSGLFDFALLADAGVDLAKVTPGAVQP